MPRRVRQKMGFAIYFAQRGERHESTKVLTGFGGAGVLEVVDDDARGTYRAVYTVRFREAIYVLHVFQKKSKHSRATPKRDVEMIRVRLREAARRHAENQGG